MIWKSNTNSSLKDTTDQRSDPTDILNLTNLHFVNNMITFRGRRKSIRSISVQYNTLMYLYGLSNFSTSIKF